MKVMLLHVVVLLNVCGRFHSYSNDETLNGSVVDYLLYNGVE